MRKYKRYMAHKSMERAGLKHVNRQTQRRDNSNKRDSYFALNWRDWVHA